MQVWICLAPVPLDELTVCGWQRDADGLLAIPDGPGLGIELDLDAVEKHSGGQRLD